MTTPLANAVTTTSAATLVQTSVLDSNIIEAMYSATVMRPLVAAYNLTGRPSNTIEIPIWPAMGAPTDDLGETVDLTPSALTTTEVSISTKEIGQMLAITDRLQEDDILAGLAEYGRQLGKSIADKMDADLTALLGGHSVVTGDAAGKLTLDHFQTAISELDAQDAPKPYVAVLHPKQWSQLSRAVVASQASVWVQNGGDTRFGAREAYVGTLLGVDVFQTTNVPATSSVRKGAMFSRGRAHAFVSKREPRTEMERDASARATEIVVTARYGVAELRDLWGVTLQSLETAV